MTDNYEEICALSFLPELVWELVLDALDDSKDIQNMLSAFPELDLRFHRFKTVWLFDQVYPHLITRFLRDKDIFIKVCRQSCKRWCSVADSFIQNHPSRRPYNQNGITRRTVPYRDFSYTDWIDEGHDVFLRTHEQLQSFQGWLTKHPSPDNLLKLVRIHIVIRHTNKLDNAEFARVLLTFLKSFGKFIWHIVLNVSIFEPGKFLQCLSYLPNVRNLTLCSDFRVPSSLIKKWKPKLRNALPQLSYLETLEWGAQTPSFVQRPLIHHMKLQIKKLSIHSEDFCHTSSLKNLVELEIVFEDFYFNDYEIQPTLNCFPFLKRLSFHFALGFPQGQDKMSTCNLFEILAHTKLEELRLYDCPIIETCICFYRSKNMHKFSSIKYLFLEDYEDQELNFLTAFPSLEHLEIHWSEDICKGTRKQFEKYKQTWSQLDTLTSIVRCYIYQWSDVPASVNIWDKMASLKLLSTANWNSTFEAKFAREYGNKPFYSFDNLSWESVGTGTDDEDTSDSDSYYDDENDEDDDDLEMSEDGSYADFSSGSNEVSMPEEVDRNYICQCCEIF